MDIFLKIDLFVIITLLSFACITEEDQAKNNNILESCEYIQSGFYRTPLESSPKHVCIFDTSDLLSRLLDDQNQEMINLIQDQDNKCNKITSVGFDTNHIALYEILNYEQFISIFGGSHEISINCDFTYMKSFDFNTKKLLMSYSCESADAYSVLFVDSLSDDRVGYRLLTNISGRESPDISSSPSNVIVAPRSNSIELFKTIIKQDFVDEMPEQCL
ncbi:hypothetical protein KKB55_04765 [Myxococcota bacterium]|nr:hypothetical protein [Myxococcota bacterium]MBU1897064.1 hypothetical protein [Myxococcota bacterium]